MKHVVSVSLGSSTGDFEREIRIGDDAVRVVREGVDGDIERAKERLRDLDGVVDAIGLGGIDITIRVAGKEFTIGDGLRLAQVVHHTPVVDGSGLKDTLERDAVRRLADRGLAGPGTKVLMVGSLDRFGMAEEFVGLGCECVFGDLMFHIGIDYPLRTLADVDEYAEKMRSRLLTVSFHLLYPTGDKQLERKPDPRFQKYYDEAHIIAGDRHLIHRHMPETLPGKGILTTTTRPDTIAAYRSAGVSWVSTTTPDLDGVSAGTNLMEAALVASTGRPVRELTRGDYLACLNHLGWHSSFHTLEGES
ncbi:MAG: quinate 5-dehydrogenase [Capsulimonadaceae bacterium]